MKSLILAKGEALAEGNIPLVLLEEKETLI